MGGNPYKYTGYSGGLQWISQRTLSFVRSFGGRAGGCGGKKKKKKKKVFFFLIKSIIKLLKLLICLTVENSYLTTKDRTSYCCF